MMLRLSLAAVLAIASISCPALDADQQDALYKKGSKLIEPYMLLSDRPNADASTREAREQLREGIEALEQVVEADPRKASAYWIMGMAYRALEDYGRATVAFGKAYAINPKQPNFAREYSYSCMCSGLTKRAVEVAADNAAQHPADAGIISNLGLALLADGQLEKARDATVRSLVIDPKDEVTKRLLDEIDAVHDGKKPGRYCR
jgi:Flp pilus assembly protein TadD